MSKSGNKNPETSFWAGIIDAVKTPLGFYVLISLISTSILSIAIPFITPPEQTIIIWSTVGIIILLILIVTGFAIFKPSSLGSNQTSIENSEEKTKEIEERVEEIAVQESVSREEIDPKLVKFIPPLAPTKFKTLRLPRTEPLQLYRFNLAPTGHFIVYGIPFFLLPIEDRQGNPIGHHVIEVQPSKKLQETINVEIKDATNIHMLISAGLGWRLLDDIQFLHKRVGYLRLCFDDGSEQRTDLVLGRHLREWSFGNNPNLVTELDLDVANPAWVSHDGSKRFDLVSIPIQNNNHSLIRIEIVGKFEDEDNRLDLVRPSIIISAITVER